MIAKLTTNLNNNLCYVPKETFEGAESVEGGDQRVGAHRELQQVSDHGGNSCFAGTRI